MNNIKEILRDLYKIDPTLREHEPDLIKILNKLITNKPNINLDENFIKKLKSELAEEKTKSFNLFNFIYMKKISFVAAGAGLMLVVALVLINLLNRPEINLAIKSSEITKLSDRAFGDLNFEMSSSDMKGVAGMGAGGGGNYSESDSASAPIEGRIMPYPYYQYKYTYVGDDFSIDEDKMEVYKRQKELNVSPKLSLNLDQINLQKFANAKLQNITIMEEQEYGYMVNVNFTEGMISINQNWQTWPIYESTCAGIGGDIATKCVDSNRLFIDDIPSDDKILEIADSFVREYKINITDYAEPIIDNRWRTYYENSEDKNNYYVPDTISVIYPLTIQDKKIYNYGGEPDGLMISVNIREMKVSGAWNIMPNNYQSSLYDVEQDTSKILKLAEQGGNGYVYFDEAAKIIEINLGKPELIYVKTYNYKNGNSEELIVPALSFPILNKPANYYLYQENVVVPILKELVDERLSEDQIPMPRPLLEEASPSESDAEIDSSIENAPEILKEM